MDKIDAGAFVGNRKTSPTYKFLSAADERSLIERWQRHQDAAARDQLLAAFMPLLFGLAADFVREKGIQDADLTELAHMGAFGLEVDKDSENGESKARGFVHAIAKFDLSQPYRLSTYSRHWVNAALREWYRLECCNGVHVPKGEEFFKQVSGNDPLNLDGGISTRYDTIEQCAIDGETTAQQRERFATVDAGAAALERVLDRLSPIERRIIEGRALSTDKPIAFDRLGNELGFSGEWARRIEQKAKAKIARAVRTKPTFKRSCFRCGLYA